MNNSSLTPLFTSEGSSKGNHMTPKEKKPLTRSTKDSQRFIRKTEKTTPKKPPAKPPKKKK